MLTLVRIVLGLAGLAAVWIVSYWAYFVHYDRDGAVFMGRGAPFLLGLVAAAARLRRLQASPRAARWLRLAGGALFLGLALRLAGARA